VKIDRAEVRKQASLRVLGKLGIILFAAVAYGGLYLIERSKDNYDKEQAAPLVLVSQPNPDEKKEIGLPIADVKKMISFSKIKDDKKKQAYEEEISRYLEPGMMYQPFRNEASLIDEINARILNKRGEDEKAKLTAKANRLKSIEGLRSQLSNIYADPQAVLRQNHISTDGLTTIIPLHLDKQSGQAAASSTAAKKLARSDLADVIIGELKTAENDRTQKDLDEIDGLAVEKIEAIYASLKPTLPDYVRARREIVQKRNPFFRSVLDTNSGGHVIYLVLRLTFLAVIVFSVLFVILMLLRPLPPFSNSTEVITDGAKSFLSRGRGEGGMFPEIARSAVVTAAALGIGTAVVVASGVAGGPGNVAPIEDPSYVAETQGPGDRPWQPWSIHPRPSPAPTEVPVPSPGPTDTPGPIEPTVPVIYAPHFDVPQVDESKLTSLKGQIDNLQTYVDRSVMGEVTRIDRDSGQLKTLLGNVSVPELSRTVKENNDNLTGRAGQLDLAISGLNGKLDKDFSEKLKETRNVVEAVRSDNLERLQRNVGRNLFTRTKQLFGKERYLVTEQSYRALVNIMCSLPCDNADTCVQVCPKSLPVNDILITLRGMRWQEPQEESTFLKNFKNKPGFAGWKAVILRYTRASY
jgi:hypothetical protein